MTHRLPSAPFAGASLLAGYGVVAASGSRPLGGMVLLTGGLSCAALWRARHGARTAAELLAVGFGAFVLSHLLALAIGAWPAVIVCAALASGVVYVRADLSIAPAPKEA